MASLWGRSRKTLGFVVVPALSLVTPLLVIPLVARHGGGGAVVAVAVGQSIGLVGSLVVSLAWPLTGSPLVARLPREARPAVYVESIESRAAVFLVAGPVCALAAALLAQSFLVTAAFSAVAITANGLSAAWYYIGTGEPRGLLLFEALVRLGSAGLAAAALALGAPIVAYPLLLCLGAGASLVLNWRHVVSGAVRPRLHRGALTTVHNQLRSTLARLAYGLYQAGAVSIVAAVSAGSVLAFSAYDRTQKSLLLAAQAGPDSVISWVASPTPGLGRRQRLVLVGDAVFCAVLAGVFYAALPVVLDFMYAGLVTVDTTDRLLAAAGLGLAQFSKCVVSHALVPSDAERAAATLLVVTALVGVVLIAGGAALFGTAGALGAVVVVESAAIVVGLVAWGLTRRPALLAASSTPAG